MYIKYNIVILPSFNFFCSNDRPNGGITEYLLYHNNQVVYRGKDRQHNITGKEESVYVCVCVYVCCSVAVTGAMGPRCKEKGKSEEKQNGVGD